MVDSPISHPQEWLLVRLGDICTKIGSGATPRGGEEFYKPERSRFALVRSQNVFDRHFETMGLAFISDDQADRLQSVVLQPGDLLLNITGDGITFSRCCIIPNHILPACVNQHVAIIRVDPGIADPGYILAYLTHTSVKSYIESFNAGGSRRAITKGHIESFRIPLPPLEEQRSIAHILGTLDDKIELNRRMNETLEEIAGALFKSWFIDFWPVRANAEGRKPVGFGPSDVHILSTSMVESSLGLVPKGWKICTWGDLVTLEYGKSLSGYNTQDGAYPVYGTNGRIGSHSQPLCRHPGIIIGRKGAYRGVHFCSSPFFVIDTAFYVEPKVPLEMRWAFYEILRQDINGMDSGSAIPSTSRDDFYRLPVLTPPYEIQQRFVELMNPLWVRQEKNKEESQTLAALRDTLLTKLLSGEIRIRDAERFVARHETD
jgi:type I restriction enzyme S subunit